MADRYLVFSDVDETLIHCKSMFDFLEFFLVERYGTAGRERYDRVWAEVKAGNAAGRDRAAINREYYRQYAGESVAEVTESGLRWFHARREAGALWIDSTVAALREHQQRGAVLALVSGSFPAPLGPIAQAVGADHLLCADPLATSDGKYTGEIVEPVIGPGKSAAVRRLLVDYPDVNPADCYGYGDHPSDIPMLDLVGRPAMVGDNPDLRAYLDNRLAATA